MGKNKNMEYFMALILPYLYLCKLIYTYVK